jgi:hypothetical protein
MQHVELVEQVQFTHWPFFSASVLHNPKHLAQGRCVGISSRQWNGHLDAVLVESWPMCFALARIHLGK